MRFLGLKMASLTIFMKKRRLNDLKSFVKIKSSSFLALVTT